MRTALESISIARTNHGVGKRLSQLETGSVMARTPSGEISANLPESRQIKDVRSIDGMDSPASFGINLPAGLMWCGHRRNPKSLT